MRSGIRTYVAIALFVVLFVPLTGAMLWTPGLLGVLSMLGGFMLLPATAALTFGVLLFVVGVTLNARGTFNAREHIRDMLPGAILVLSIVAIVSALR